MRLTIGVGVTVMLMRGLLGHLSPFSNAGLEELRAPPGPPSVDAGRRFLVEGDDDDPEDAVDLDPSSYEGNSSPDESRSERRQNTDVVPDERILIAFDDDGIRSNGKRGQVEMEDSLEELGVGRRAFSPWGGRKRYFNPWGGKRSRSIEAQRKADSVFNKRPGFQPWGGKRSDKRAFNPWGGKRSSAYRSRDSLQKMFDMERELNENKNFLMTI